MTPAQLAKDLGLTRDAIHKAIKRGRLKAALRTDERGSYYWITEEDAAAYAAAEKSKGGRPRKERKG